MKKYILLLSAVLSIGATTYFSLLPLNWFTQADISDKFPTSITPTWITFSIWSFIYLSWLILWILIFNWKIEAKSKEIYYFSMAILMTSVWLIPWHFEYITTSFVIMLIIVWSLLKLFFMKHENIIFKSSVELFLWWILTATILNLHVLLVYLDKYTFPALYTTISILIWTTINYIFQRNYNSFITSIVFIWALIWIIVKQQNDSIQIISFLSIVFLLLNMFWSRFKLRKSLR